MDILSSEKSTPVSRSISLNSGHQMCEDFFPHTKQLSDSPDTSWVSYYNLTQVCHCLPAVGIRPDRVRAQSHNPAPTSDADHKSGSHLCF